MNLEIWGDLIRRDEFDRLCVLKAHYKLSEFFRTISKQNRSLASKYLHFHYPEHFFIYDQNAAIAIKRLTNNGRYKRFKASNSEHTDGDYEEFYDRCVIKKNDIENTTTTKHKVTPRELDNALLAVFHHYNLGKVED
jgi:hypothetical protein